MNTTYERLASQLGEVPELLLERMIAHGVRTGDEDLLGALAWRTELPPSTLAQLEALDDEMVTATLIERGHLGGTKLRAAAGDPRAVIQLAVASLADLPQETYRRTLTGQQREASAALLANPDVASEVAGEALLVLAAHHPAWLAENLVTTRPTRTGELYQARVAQAPQLHERIAQLLLSVTSDERTTLDEPAAVAVALLPGVSEATHAAALGRLLWPGREEHTMVLPLQRMLESPGAGAASWRLAEGYLEQRRSQGALQTPERRVLGELLAARGRGLAPGFGLERLRARLAEAPAEQLQALVVWLSGDQEPGVVGGACEVLLDRADLSFEAAAALTSLGCLGDSPNALDARLARGDGLAAVDLELVLAQDRDRYDHLFALGGDRLRTEAVAWLADPDARAHPSASHLAVSLASAGWLPQLPAWLLARLAERCPELVLATIVGALGEDADAYEVFETLETGFAGSVEELLEAARRLR